MRRIFTTLFFCLAVTMVFAQAPEKFTYQAVVRNANNTLVASSQVGVRVSILQGSASGSAVYVETQTATTNANGLMTLNIGEGSVQQGTFASIDWANGPFFLKTETDPNGGNNYTVTSTQQLLSVPYALYAKTAENGFSGDYNDLTNTPTIPTVPTNVSTFTNDAGYLTDADIADLLTTVDALLDQVDSLNRVVRNAGGQPVVMPNRPCPGMPTIMDYDSNVYRTVQIGWQCWMKENLRTTHYANGTLLNPWSYETGMDVPYRYPAYGILDSVPIYGYHYNWYATVQQVNLWDTVIGRIQGICPNGWHVPSLEEWADMLDYVRSQEDFWCDGDSIKTAKSLAHPQGWYPFGSDECIPSVNPSQNNATGFSARPTGHFWSTSLYYTNQTTNFWTSTPKADENGHAWHKTIEWGTTYVRNYHNGKSAGYNVRCLRDLPVQH